MTDLEHIEEILKTNGFHETKKKHSSYDFVQKIEKCYEDNSKRKLNLFVNEYNGGCFNRQIYLYINKKFEIDYYHYYIDRLEVQEHEFFDYLIKEIKNEK